MSSATDHSECPVHRRGADASTGASDEDEIQAARAANRFDIRRLIGGVFLLYGLILLVSGCSAHTRSRTRRPESTSICGPESACWYSAR